PESVSERARLKALLAGMSMAYQQADEAWAEVDEAFAMAEPLHDPSLMGAVLMSRAVVQSNCGEPQHALKTAQEALALLPEHALWDRVDMVEHVMVANFRLGRLAEVERLVPEVGRMAARSGSALAIWIHRFTELGLRTMRTGDLRAYLAELAHAE